MIFCLRQSVLRPLSFQVIPEVLSLMTFMGINCGSREFGVTLISSFITDHIEKGVVIPKERRIKITLIVNVNWAIIPNCYEYFSTSVICARWTLLLCEKGKGHGSTEFC